MLLTSSSSGSRGSPFFFTLVLEEPWTEALVPIAILLHSLLINYYIVLKNYSKLHILFDQLPARVILQCIMRRSLGKCLNKVVWFDGYRCSWVTFLFFGIFAPIYLTTFKLGTITRTHKHQCMIYWKEIKTSFNYRPYFKNSPCNISWCLRKSRSYE